jgi:hypothetical protein
MRVLEGPAPSGYVLTGGGEAKVDAAAPHRMLAKAPFVTEAATVFQHPPPAMFFSHFCVYWAIVCSEFAEREDAVQICEVCTGVCS